MRILIVDDNGSGRALLERLFTKCGYIADTARDGVEALEKAIADPPDLIISDVRMPRMDGFELCDKCKKDDRLKDIPFVFYSATYTTEEAKKFAISLGARAFIVKPSSYEMHKELDIDGIISMLGTDELRK